VNFINQSTDETPAPDRWQKSLNKLNIKLINDNINPLFKNSVNLKGMHHCLWQQSLTTKLSKNMKPHNSSTDNIKQSIRRAASHAWFERLARLGYASKGLVYFIVGFLAAQAAFSMGGRTTDTSGALSAIVNQPFGKFLLFLVTIGIIGYALWRIVQTIIDPEHQGQKMDAKRIAQRIGYALSALAYAGLALTAVKLNNRFFLNSSSKAIGCQSNEGIGRCVGNSGTTAF
jgi:hypothetical protein